MAQDSSSIHQFRALAAVERAFAENPAVAGSALERMQRPLDLGARTAVGMEAHAERLGADNPFEHLREHWLSGAYFPNIPGDTITDGLIKGFHAAVEAVQATKKPLIPIWVCVTEDSNATDFRVDHVETETAIVVAIMTPRPAQAPKGGR
jgi:hypothetical protein